MSVYGSTLSFTMSSESGVRVAADLVRRERQMRVLHKAINLMMSFQQEFELEATFVRLRERAK